ncbi:zinc finger protein 692 isoform X6 [Pteropus alecto]|uniref:zinc finger protein 692 isoform X6 n=1 Tax=Pteropus alecto TaxID=9402 RepID=UPI000D536B11|nr:zinc finger protein 692 isoform X6 [Pteropus alecto]
MGRSGRRSDCSPVPNLPPTALVHAACTSGRGGMGAVAANAMATVWCCPHSTVRRRRPAGGWRVRPAHARPPSCRPRAMAASPADASRRRRENRRQLDARRSKCRIRLGGHMEQWCLLKERLGFSLHSQLAKFLLDRYTSSGCVLCAEASQNSYHRLHLSSSLQTRVSAPLTPPVLIGLECEHEARTREARSPSGVRPPPESFLPLREEEGEEEDGNEEEVLSDVSPWTYSSSPDGSEPDVPRPPPSPVTHTLKEGETPPAPAAVPTSLPVEGGAQLVINGIPPASQQTEALASPGSQAPSAVPLALEEDSEHIGPKRIRRAARRELLPCDFPGCGRIFSNRQYLNHHKKYQHIHQKSFSCPEPACGKSFNFKKHLKEHVKLHSDTRDYICEFCARSFRTSSNLVIHRRIHTGEKPLQCEICGFTCRQKASLNWHRRKHAETVATLRFPCEVCGKRFEKPDSVTAHCSKSHPALFLAPPGSPGPLEPHHSTSAPAPLGHGDGCRPSGVLSNDPRD